MSTIRFKALADTMHRKPVEVAVPSGTVATYFGENVFGKDAMRQFLSEEAYSSVMAAIEKGEALDRKMADQIASG
ncbi:MAG: glutamine synthetase III, partial [Bacteroidia bacterium]